MQPVIPSQAKTVKNWYSRSRKPRLDSWVLHRVLYRLYLHIIFKRTILAKSKAGCCFIVGWQICICCGSMCCFTKINQILCICSHWWRRQYLLCIMQLHYWVKMQNWQHFFYKLILFMCFNHAKVDFNDLCNCCHLGWGLLRPSKS